jgi:hypothetical protein
MDSITDDPPPALAPNCRPLARPPDDRDADLSKTSISLRISDHYSLWVEFRV